MAVVKLDTDTGEILDNAKKNTDLDNAKKNTDFVMLYRSFISQIADLGTADAQALRVLLFLVRHMDTKNALIAPMHLIADSIGLSRQSVSAKIKYLKEHGWIAIAKSGNANIYIVNPDVVWTAYADQKYMAKFEANVILDKDDNWNLGKDCRETIRHIDSKCIKILQKLSTTDDDILGECDGHED